MKAIKMRLYFYTGACTLGVTASLLFLIGADEPGQTWRLTPTLMLTLSSAIVAAIFAVKEGGRLREARLIVDNQILHIPSAIFQIQQNGKRADYHPKKSVEVFVSGFGILLNSETIKFNREGIRLKNVEMGQGCLSLEYGTDISSHNIILLYHKSDGCSPEDIIERFRYETGITPDIRKRGSGAVMVERIKCGVVNCYLLTGSGGSVLADAGGSTADVVRIYSRVKDKNVRLILLTHGHPDHMGAAFDLAGLLCVPVAMSREDAPLLEAPAVRKLHGHTFLGRVLALAANRNLTAADTRPAPDIWLEDGQELSEYGVEARIISLSGHTKGSVGVLTSGGDFVVGDALFHIIRPTAALLYENRQQMEKSAGIILGSGAAYLYPGHGRPFPVQKLTRSGDMTYRPGLL